jgi:opacity protein-like surface antigen
MKNYCFVFLFSIAFAFGSNAQTIPALGVYYSPAYTSRITQANNDLSWLKKEWDNLESGSMGYSIGAFAERSFSSSLSVRVGVGYSTFSERADSLIDLGIDKYRTDYKFIEVPVVASYYFGENKYRKPYLSAGYSMNYFLNKSITHSMVGSSREEKIVLKGDEKSINHAVRIAAGFDFVLDKKWILKTEIFASQFISSLTKDGVSLLPFSAGLSVQIRKK